MIVEDCALPYLAVMPLSRVAKSPKTFRRNSQQRREIREVFECNDPPLPADEILDLAQHKVAGRGIATVYYSIKALTDEGWLVPGEMPGAPPRYELRGKARHHIDCLNCGNPFELDGWLERLGELIPQSFYVVDHVVLLYGYCTTCDRTRTSKFAATGRSQATKQ